MAIPTNKEIIKALGKVLSPSALKKKKLEAYEEALGSDDSADILDEYLYSPVVQKVAHKLGFKRGSQAYNSIEDVLMDEIDKIKVELK